MKIVLFAVALMATTYAHAQAKPFDPINTIIVNDNSAPVPVTVEDSSPLPITVQENTSLPVTVQESVVKQPVWCDVNIIIDQPADAGWRNADGDTFFVVPDGQVLVVTDIIISTSFSDPDDPQAGVGFFRKDSLSGSSQRIFGVDGLSFPFSHTFETPIVRLGAGYELQLIRETDTDVDIVASGYLVPANG